jgi:hypothetical protein
MGGKTGTTSQSTTIPPEVLARYNSVNATAENAAAKPFQAYSSDPNSFVAPLNEQQQKGISNVNNYANSAQSGYQGAMGGTAAASQGYNAPNYQQGVQGYMNPYLQNAMGSTAAMMQNQNQQQQNQLRGSAVQQGAFGGDRGNVAQAALMGQQNLAMGQTLGNMANQGYQNAAQNYMTGLSAQGALANQYGNLAGAAQTAGLQGAQAQLGAGTLGQQTEQAGKTAMYNQFLQGQAYPFQVAQFLANIAEGTGALSGSNTTTTQPMSFFSDRRLKHDIKHVGTADNGLPIYKFKYKGDDTEQTHIGFMAQDVEKVHPEAVGLSGGYKTVDYEKASEPVRKYAGGLVSEGGAVGMEHMGEGFAGGGYANDPYDPYSIQNILARQQNVYSAIDAHHVPMARDLAGGIGKHGRVPSANLPVGSLMKSGPVPQLPQDDAISRASQIANLGETGMKYKERYDAWKASENAKQQAESQKSRTPEQGFNASDTNKSVVKTSDASDGGLNPFEDKELFAARGGLMGDGASETPQGLYSENPNGTLDIPDENNAAKYKLLQEQKLPGSMQDPTMKDIMTIAAMIKSSGGRAGYEEGGKAFDQDPDAIFKKMLQIESGGKQFAADGTTPIIPEKFRNDPDAPIGISQIKPSTAQGVAKDLDLEYDPSRLRTDEGYNQKLGRGYFGQHFSKYGDSPEKAVAAYNAGPGNVEKAIAAAGPGGNWKEYLPEETKNYISKVFGYGLEQPNLPVQTASMKSSPAAKEGKSGGLSDFFTTENVVPILTGLGAMASSKSPFLGAAALQGLGAGAESYMGTRKSLADIAQSEAATAAMKAETAQNRLFVRDGQLFLNMQGPGGTEGNIISAYDWVYGDPASRPPLTADQERQVREFVAKNPKRSAGLSPDIAPSEQPKAGLGIASEDLPKPAPSMLSQDAIGMVEANRRQALVGQDPANDVFTPQKAITEAARTQRGTLVPLAGSFARLPTIGLNASGPTQAILKPLTDVMNNLGAVLGKPDLIKNPEVLTNQNEVNKLISQLQVQGATAAGQRAYAALQEIGNTIPSGLMDSNSQARLMAHIMAVNQKEIDRGKYYTDFYNQVAGPNKEFSRFAKYSGNGLDNQFEKDYSRPFYANEEKALEGMFKAKIPQMNNRTVMDVLSSGEPLTGKQKESIRAKYGDKVLRYFGIDE